MKVFAAQLDIVWENKAANFARVGEMISASAPPVDSLVVLPEMFATGFSLDLNVTRQDSRQEDEVFLSNLARQHRVFVAAGVVNPGAEGFGRNEAVVFSPEGVLLARYTKIHPCCPAGEDGRHERGAEIATFAWGPLVVAPFICYDLRFPEIFRAATRRGANAFVVMALWPVKRQQHWLTLLQARAIENQAYVIGVNRVGVEPDLSYCGRSIVVDPHGVIIADAGEQERVLVADVDPQVVTSWRNSFSAVRDAHWTDESPQPVG